MRPPLWLELSRGNVPLARAELAGAVRALGGAIREADDPAEELVAVDLAEGQAATLVGRLALARRALVERASGETREVTAWFRAEGSQGTSARLRSLASLRTAVADPAVLGFARAYIEGGGRVDLRAPARRFVYARNGGGWRIFEEVALADRASFEARRMPRLPFQRPVSLAPRLGRVAANLARVRPGDRVVDPFCGTGALLLEAALLGARCTGVDRDATMVRGALRNLAFVGVGAEELRVADAADAFPPPSGGGWDAVLTDPPYGRQSGAGGEAPSSLLARCLPRWTPFVRRGGFAVVIVPGGGDPLGDGWSEIARVPDRVHRSLTREFRVYERS